MTAGSAFMQPMSMVATPERAAQAVRATELPAYNPLEGAGAPLQVNNGGNVWVPQRARPRRNRKSDAMRRMVRETIVTPANFIYPLFIHEEVRKGQQHAEISAASVEHACNSVHYYDIVVFRRKFDLIAHLA